MLCVCTYKQTEHNKLTLSVLELCAHLVDYGAYGSLAEVKELVRPLMKLLNGVTDLTHESELALEHAVVRDASCVSSRACLPVLACICMRLSRSMARARIRRLGTSKTSTQSLLWTRSLPSAIFS